MLTIYRRHRTRCKSTSRTAKCSCPIWVQGTVHGETVRRSLDLTNWEAATKKIRKWEVHGIRHVVMLKDAYLRFLSQHEANGSAPDTLAKHRRLMERMVGFLGNVPFAQSRLMTYRASVKAGNSLRSPPVIPLNVCGHFSISAWRGAGGTLIPPLRLRFRRSWMWNASRMSLMNS